MSAPASGSRGTGAPPTDHPNASAAPGAAQAQRTERLYRHAGIVTAFTLLSRILGMARDLVIAHRFGAGAATDAFVQAFRIPNALRRLTAEGSMTIAFIPIYVRVREEQGPEAARAFARRVLGIVLAATLLLAAAGIVFSEGLTALFSPGFRGEPDKFELTARMLRWTFPYLVLVSLVAWAMGVLNSEGRFAAPAAAPILLNVGIIGAVLGFDWAFEPAIMAVAAGVLVGGVAQVLLQGPSLLGMGLRPLPLAGWRDPDVARLFRLLLPALFGVAVYEVNLILLGIIASYLPTGQIFHYNNATRLTELVLGVFTFAFTTAGQPAISELVARKDWEGLRDTVRLTFAAVLFTIVPAMAGLVAFGQPIVAMLYQHGAFLQADVVSTANALAAMALGMPAVAAVRVMVPVFYAAEDSRTPVKVSAATLLVTGSAGWLLSLRWEVVGLAAGLSLGTWFQAGLLGLLLGRRAMLPPGWLPRRSLVRQGAAALAMAALVWALGHLGDWPLAAFSLRNWAVFALAIGGGVLVYFSLCLALKDPQAAHWLRLLRRIRARLLRRSAP